MEKQFPFTFPESQKQEVKKIADERNCSIAQVIRDAITQYINKHKNE